MQGDSLVNNSDRDEIAFILYCSYGLKLSNDEEGEGTRALGKASPVRNSRKCYILKLENSEIKPTLFNGRLGKLNPNHYATHHVQNRNSSHVKSQSYFWKCTPVCQVLLSLFLLIYLHCLCYYYLIHLLPSLLHIHISRLWRTGMTPH